MKRQSTLLFVLFALICQGSTVSAALVTFEGRLPSTNASYNGGPVTNADGFTIDGVFFPNDYTATFDAWSGWSYSNIVDTTTQSYLNQYAAWPGSGSQGSSSYGIAYLFEPTYISFAAPVIVSSADLANTTWSALTMLNGDPFGSKKYGGELGDDPDYLLLTIEGRTGMNGQGATTGAIDFYLGDFRASDNALDFVRSGWTNVDLASLGEVQSLRFSMTSTDVGIFGINTPTYFAIDNIEFSSVPEPNSLMMLMLFGLGLMRHRRPSYEGRCIFQRHSPSISTSETSSASMDA